jgi:hypothetical protein
MKLSANTITQPGTAPDGSSRARLFRYPGIRFAAESSIEITLDS